MRNTKLFITLLLAVAVLTGVESASATTPPCVYQVKRLNSTLKSKQSAERRAQSRVDSADRTIYSRQLTADKAAASMESKLLKYRLKEEAYKQGEIMFDAQCALMLLFPKQFCASIPQYSTGMTFNEMTGEYEVYQTRLKDKVLCAETQQSCLAKAVYLRTQTMIATSTRQRAQQSEQRKVDRADLRVADAQQKKLEAQAVLTQAHQAVVDAEAAYNAASASCQG